MCQGDCLRKVFTLSLVHAQLHVLRHIPCSLLIHSGIDPSVPFSKLRKFQPKGPLVNSEFYPGWLDHWAEGHQKREAASIGMYLDKILAMNASVNMYMFHGGTSFGFMNGKCKSSVY